MAKRKSHMRKGHVSRVWCGSKKLGTWHQEERYIKATRINEAIIPDTMPRRLPNLDEVQQEQKAPLSLMDIDKQIRQFLNDHQDCWDIYKLRSIVREEMKRDLEKFLGMEIPWEMLANYLSQFLNLKKIVKPIAFNELGNDDLNECEYTNNTLHAYWHRDIGLLESGITIEGEGFGASGDSVMTTIDIDCTNLIAPAVSFEYGHIVIKMSGEWERDHLNFWAKAISYTLGDLIPDLGLPEHSAA